MVAVADVPVMAVPVYHLPPAVPVEPVAPCFATEYMGADDVPSVYVNTIRVQRYEPAATEGGVDAHVPVGAVVFDVLLW